MYRFTRMTTVKNSAMEAPALKFAADVVSYLNKAYGMNLRYGVKLFGPREVYWTLDAASLDEIGALQPKLMMDREYQALLERTKELFVEGSIQDSIVAYP
jgi:hypothetical protein